MEISKTYYVQNDKIIIIEYVPYTNLHTLSVRLACGGGTFKGAVPRLRGNRLRLLGPDTYENREPTKSTTHAKFACVVNRGIGGLIEN